MRMLGTGLEIEPLIKYLWESKESPSPSVPGDAQQSESRDNHCSTSAKLSLGSLSSCDFPFIFLLWGVHVGVCVFCFCYKPVLTHEQSLGWSDGEGLEEDAFEEWGLIAGSLSICYLYMVSFTLKRKYNSNTAIHGYRSSVHKQMGMPVLLYLVSGSGFRSLLRSKRALVPSPCFMYAIPLQKQCLQMNIGCQKCDKFKQTSSHNYQRNLYTKEERELCSMGKIKKKSPNIIYENKTKGAIVEMSLASSQNIWFSFYP